MPEFTLTESKLLHVLSDGRQHTKEELFNALGDPLLEQGNVNVMIVRIKAKLRPIGEDVICNKTGNVSLWRHVRIVSIT